MYGIAFGLEQLNQGGALVLVYRDGSVLLTHGGIEMGQVSGRGRHTPLSCWPHPSVIILTTPIGTSY